MSELAEFVHWMVSVLTLAGTVAILVVAILIWRRK